MERRRYDLLPDYGKRIPVQYGADYHRNASGSRKAHLFSGQGKRDSGGEGQERCRPDCTARGSYAGRDPISGMGILKNPEKTVDIRKTV